MSGIFTAQRRFSPRLVLAAASAVATGLLLAGYAHGVITDNPNGDVIVVPPGEGGMCAKPCPAATGDLIFLNVDGIPGESTHAHHPDEIVIQSWSWGAVQRDDGGTALKSGKVDVKELTVVKSFDKSSPKLMEALMTGKHIKEIELKVHRQSGDRADDYLKLKLTDVVVSSHSVSQNQGSATTEIVSFNFAKFQVEYQPQSPTGESGPNESFGWDLKKNVRA